MQTHPGVGCKFAVNKSTGTSKKDKGKYAGGPVEPPAPNFRIKEDSDTVWS